MLFIAIKSMDPYNSFFKLEVNFLNQDMLVPNIFSAGN